jgi:hypothetical protein
MENEELAALRTTLLAAERQPSAARARQARLGALFPNCGELLPYVPADSCRDPRDRVVRGSLDQLRVLEGASLLPVRRAAAARSAEQGGSSGLVGRRGRRSPSYEPAPVPPARVAAFAMLLAVLFLLGHMLVVALAVMR